MSQARLEERADGGRQWPAAAAKVSDVRLETGGGLVRAARGRLGLEKLLLLFFGAFRAHPLGLGNRRPTHLGFISLVRRRHPHYRVAHAVGLGLETVAWRADPQLGLDDAQDVTGGAIADRLLQPQEALLGGGFAP
jgi:hypothetical protein